MGLTSFAGGAFATTAVADQQTVHGSETVVSHCDYNVVPVLLPAHDPLRVEVKVSSDASPQPHESGPMTLSNTTAELRVGADYFQGGVDAGIIDDGFTMPATVSVTLAGSNTVEGTRTLTESMTTTLRVVDGVARPLVLTLDLPDTVWHPDSRDIDVLFREKSARLELTADIAGIGRLDLTAQCPASAARPFVALVGSATTTTSAPSSTFIVDPPIVGQTTTAPAPTTVPTEMSLPRTGSNSGYAAFFALICILAGVLLLVAGRRSHAGR